jgi:ATP synthase protein I
MAEGGGGPEDDRVLRARLDRLSGDLKARRKAVEAQRSADGGADNSGKSGAEMGLGMRVASEFAGSIVVGGFIGWQLDYWLGTKPAFLIIFFMLGVAAGVWNLIRVTSRMSRSGPKTGEQAAPPASARSAPLGADDDED